MDSGRAGEAGGAIHAYGVSWEKGIRLPDAEELRILAKVLNCSFG